MEFKTVKAEEITDPKQLQITFLSTKAVSLHNEILSTLLLVSDDEKDLYAELLCALNHIRNLIGVIDIYNDKNI